jgi:glucosamine 6-phosphate synthetase-like amidotransferase/phosphosugar isomerase protein
MCGIYCSNDLSTFEILEEANRKRGNFSTGILHCYNKANYNVIKEKGNINWENTKLPTEKGWLYLGHNQAPTETGRDWKGETSHPFWVGDWMVAHNGVLTNYEELIDDYVPMHDNPVDSSIIPALLDEFEYNHGPCEDTEAEIQNILYTIEKLKGTFAIWIVNIIYTWQDKVVRYFIKMPTYHLSKVTIIKKSNKVYFTVIPMKV